MLSASACLVTLAAVVILNKPVTVTVDVPETVRQSQAALLRLEGVVMKRDAPAVWNIFWEMPQANAQTSVDDRHFLGVINSPANSALRDPKPANFTVQLSSEALLAGRRLRTLRFTFVPMRKLPEGGVSIGAVRLE